MPAKEVVPFGERKDDGAYANNDKRSVSGNACVQRKAADFFVLEVNEVAEFCNGQKSETACKYENASCNVDDGIVLDADERVGEQREAYAAERTYGLERGT